MSNNRTPNNKPRHTAEPWTVSDCGFGQRIYAKANERTAPNSRGVRCGVASAR
jgi:hypothetical protein